MTQDIFDNTILCKDCGKKMQKIEFSKNSFLLRAMECQKCNNRIIHPFDETEYHKFINLKNKEFKVKMRMVGNSYAVSIPKEIVNFMNEQKKIMNEMVKLCFEDKERLSLNFNTHDSKIRNTRIIKSKEVQIVRNGKPIFHNKQFSDSANPEKNKSFIIKEGLNE